jgi:hypothetical protein
MKITKLSNDFAPIDKGIFFNIDTEDSTPATIIVEIVDSLTSEVVATQQLRKITSARVNIAPYLPQFKEYEPMQNYCTAFSVAPYARYKIRVDSVESEDITVSVNKVEIENTPTIISTMPSIRRISHGECDEVLVFAGEERDIYAEITADTGEQLNLEHHTTSGANILTISTKDFGADIHTLEVVLYCEDEVFGSLRYRVTPPIKTATRLAWLSDKGSIERYSFPVTHKTKQTVERRTIITTEGPQTSQCHTKQVLSLASRFEPSDTIAALAQIASSTKVWREHNGALESIEVATQTIEQDLFGAPDSLCIDICTLNKKEGIW